MCSMSWRSRPRKAHYSPDQTIADVNQLEGLTWSQTHNSLIPLGEYSNLATDLRPGSSPPSDTMSSLLWLHT